MKTQTEVMQVKIAKLELVIALLINALRYINPDNPVLDKAEKILSKGDGK